MSTAIVLSVGRVDVASHCHGVFANDVLLETAPDARTARRKLRFYQASPSRLAERVVSVAVLADIAPANDVDALPWPAP